VARSFHDRAASRSDNGGGLSQHQKRQIICDPRDEGKEIENRKVHTELFGYDWAALGYVIRDYHHVDSFFARANRSRAVTESDPCPRATQR
jgi:hypothetical protein